MQSPVAWEYLSYHRSRIRLLRALLVLTPALGVAAAIRLANESEGLRNVAVTVVLVVYAAAFLMRSGEKLPRTTDPSKTKEKHFDLSVDKPLWKVAVRSEPLTWFVIGLAVVSGIVQFAGSLLPGAGAAGNIGAAVSGLLVAAGVVLAAGVLYASWWRVTETYFVFLRNYYKFTRPASTAPHPPSP